MNKISQNGMSVYQTQNAIIVNGVEYPIPDKVKSKGGNKITITNGRITVNGFVFNPHTGEFSRPFPWGLVIVLIAVLYLIFGR